MDTAESAAYLRHHLKLADRDDPLFAVAANKPGTLPAKPDRNSPVSVPGIVMRPA
jgi:type II secretory pathway predicted ATPase ExeA